MGHPSGCPLFFVPKKAFNAYQKLTITKTHQITKLDELG